MKDKDPKDEEFEQEGQDDINEADDSFGLPDLELTPLEEESEEEEAESSEPASEESEEAVSKEGSESEEEESGQEKEELEQPAYSVEGEDTEGEVSEEAEGEEKKYHVVESEEEDVSSVYKPPKPESNAPKIIGVLVVAIIVVAVGWYFGFYRPGQVAKEKEKARIEQQKKDVEARRLKEQQQKQAEAQRLAEEQQRQQEEDARVAAAQVTTISESTGRYYVIIGSFVDGDMAMDLGNKLSGEGTGTSLIPPFGKKKFYRLAIKDFSSFDEAQASANELKSEYGENLWVLKY